ncbi:glucose 1-dehydrogenase [Streptomyces sp. NPDC127084]|uniref:glucose 1-dehydrogenase n=1 Tax=Streptomyces sp. NPDC127084 TaxID=3347133 RepID=UPI00364DE3B9
MGEAGRVEGKTGIVTGGSRGMGEQHVRRLVAEGARVLVADVLDDAGEALAAELGDAAVFVHLDVTRPSEWERAVRRAVDEFGGRIDILVNNAGIANRSPVDGFNPADWEKIIAVNLSGVFYGMRAVVPAMKSQGGGSIVNISSVEGLRGSPGLHGYVAAKFGVRGITKSVAVEVGGFGIRVNSVHPGFIETPMTEGFDPALLQIPLARGARPEEVSDLVLFLASDESGYCTGAEFVIDGGLVAGIPHRG